MIFTGVITVGNGQVCPGRALVGGRDRRERLRAG